MSMIADRLRDVPVDLETKLLRLSAVRPRPLRNRIADDTRRNGTETIRLRTTDAVHRENGL